MFPRVLRLGLGLTISVAGVSDAATADRGDVQCRATGADALPKSAGGATALCSAIQRALAARLPGKSYSVEVRVRKHHLEAVVTTPRGKILPAVGFAQFDRVADRTTLERFGSAVADHIASHQDALRPRPIRQSRKQAW